MYIDPSPCHQAVRWAVGFSNSWEGNASLYPTVAQTVFDLYEYDLWMGGRLQEGGEVRWVSGEVVKEVAPRDAPTGEEEPQCLVLVISRVDPPALITGSCSQTKHFACQLQL